MPKIIENLQGSILQAANEILFEQGFKDFSIRSVAKKLGIAPATIYNYYNSKEGILEALVDCAWQELMDTIDCEIAEISEPVAALGKIYELFQNSMNPLFTHWITADPKALPPDHPDEHAILAKKQKIGEELTKRIENVLIRCGQDATYAPVYAKLFIMCSHHSKLTFDEIVSAIKALQ
ncbi:MAG: TetR/AcrR family transcriptional regulator [Clostridia bacterium]|nr:TetR/AcrR family transcriptional regulator [Clostridia bacterium]